MKDRVKNWLKRISHLGEVCMYCKLGQHCKGCSCCQSGS